MSIITALIQIKGKAPLLMHSSKLLDPETATYAEIKKINKRKGSKKTDADAERLAQLEFMGGLWVNEANKIILPAHVVDAAIIEGAKITREGPTAKAAVISQDALLDYGEDLSPKQLWERRKEFGDGRPVRVGQSRVWRMRPKFDNWSAMLEVDIDTTLVDPSTVLTWIRAAGKQRGIGDYRPRHGRFYVVQYEFAAKADEDELPKAA